MQLLPGESRARAGQQSPLLEAAPALPSPSHCPALGSDLCCLPAPLMNINEQKRGKKINLPAPGLVAAGTTEFHYGSQQL